MDAGIWLRMSQVSVPLNMICLAKIIGVQKVNPSILYLNWLSYSHYQLR